MDILIATLIVAAIGLLCAIMLVLAAKFFAVEEDETEKKIRECLPGANCGACGYAGCDGYAKALALSKDDKSVKSLGKVALTLDGGGNGSNYRG